MKAAQITAYGGKEVLKTIDDALRPEPKAGQLIIEVYAAAVNPFDRKVREGFMQEMAALQLPATLGGDFAGVVAAIGEDIIGFDVGDEVYGQANALSGQGSYAEFTPAKADSTAKKPNSADFVTAAALPLAGVSSYQALVEHASLQKGQKVLVHGGSGGIGVFAIQLAKHLGAYVATTVAAEDKEFAKSLGADEAIDYKSEAFETLLKNYDVVYDTVGSETFIKSYQVLKPGGIIVSMLEKPDEKLSQQYEVKVVSQFTHVTTERLSKLAALVDNGAVKVHIDKVFPLEEAGEALEYLHQGKHRGKVVLKIK